MFKWTLPLVPAVVEIMQGYAWHAGPVLFAMHGRGWLGLDEAASGSKPRRLGRSHTIGVGELNNNPSQFLNWVELFRVFYFIFSKRIRECPVEGPRYLKLYSLVRLSRANLLI